MKKRKKSPRDVATMTGNPNDIVVISPEEKPAKYRTEAVEAIKQLKSKLKAPEFVYPAPTERVDIDKDVDKQVRHIKKLVSKLSTQEVTEQDLNTVFASMNEAGVVKSILTSPIRAVGLLGKAAVATGTAATLLSHPATAALTAAGVFSLASNKLSRVGERPRSNQYADKMIKRHAAIMKRKADLARKKREANRKADIARKKREANRKEVKETTSNDIVSHKDWDREAYIQEKTTAALHKKAEKHSVDYTTVEEVFNQGLLEYDNTGNATINQYAMQKVNSFLANYLEEKKTVMVGGKRRRIIGEPPGAVYARTFVRTSGKTTNIKAPKTAQQKLRRNISTLKRKLRQNVLRLEDVQLNESGLWDNIHAKRKRIKAGSKERMRKPGSDGAPTKQNFVDASESVQESFIVDRAAGYSTTYTAADLGMKIQGGFALHPSVVEEGGAGDEGTNKLVRKYKKDTPGEALEQIQQVIRARRKANTQC